MTAPSFARRAGFSIRDIAAQLALLFFAFFAVAASATTLEWTIPGATNWTVPVGVNSIKVVATGAGGGSGESGPTNGGHGGVVTATLTVIPGQVLSLFVGGGGSHGAWVVDYKGGGWRRINQY